MRVRPGRLAERIDWEGFIVAAQDTDIQPADDVGIEVAGTGIGGRRSTTTRQLTDASLDDDCSGGAEVWLASCQAP